MNIRDEAHRFAIKYHRNLRTQSSRSVFEDIPGIGKKKARSLLKHTSHIDNLAKITQEDLAGCPSINRADIVNILKFFKVK